MNLKNLILHLTTCLLTGISLSAQTFVQGTDTLPLDSAIRYGRLTNGFTYYIKPLSDAGKKVSMELVVKAGANQQDADQFEMAHFLEHLPFAQTKHFRNILKETSMLSELHMKSEDIAGRTGGDRTVYSFNYPADNPKALGKGLLFFQDIASGNVCFEEEVINGERGAIYEEYLFAEGAAKYSTNVIYEAFSHCIKKALAPEDYKNHIENFKIPTLERFYKDWYRPDLMALKLVGDIGDVDAIERQVREAFKDIHLPDSLRTQLDCSKNYLNRPKQFLVMEEGREAVEGLPPEIIFRFYFRDEQEKMKVLPLFKTKLLKQLFVRMLNQRLQELGEAYKVTYSSHIHRDFQLPALQLKIKTLKGNEREAIVQTFATLAGLRKYGFTQQEWENAKKKMLNNLKREDTGATQYWMKELEEHFVKGEALPKDKLEKLTSWFGGLTLGRFNDMLKRYLSPPEDIAVLVPKTEKSVDYSKEEIRSWIEAGQQQLKVYQPPQAPARLMSKEQVAQLPGAKVMAKNTGSEGESIFVLENGVRLILKHFKPSPGRYRNKLLVHGFSPNGATCFAEEDLYEALFATDIVQNAGAGGFNKFDLGRFLAGTTMPFGLKNYISTYETGVTANVAVEDMEILLQLIYLYFTAPRYDRHAFEDWQAQEQKKYMGESDMAYKDFMNFMDVKLGKRSMPEGTQRYLNSKKVNFDKAYGIYKKLHGKAEDFTFIIAGDYLVEEIFPLAQKYLGSLPFNDQTYCQNKEDEVVNLVQGPVKEVFTPSRRMENAHVAINFLSPIFSKEVLKEEIVLGFLGEVLRHRLKELRYEEKMAVYFSLASSEVDWNKQEQVMHLNIRCGIDDLQAVLSYSEGIIEDLREDLIEEDTFLEIRDSYVLPRYSPSYLNKNKSMIEELYHRYRFGVPVIPHEVLRDQIKSLSREELREAAQKYLKKKYKKEFIAKSSADS